MFALVVARCGSASLNSSLLFPGPQKKNSLVIIASINTMLDFSDLPVSLSISYSIIQRKEVCLIIMYEDVKSKQDIYCDGQYIKRASI